MELKIKPRIFRKYEITEEEREKVVIRIFEFLSKHLKIEEEVKKRDYGIDNYYKMSKFNCDCKTKTKGYGWHNWYSFNCDEKGVINKKEYQKELAWIWQHYYVHLRYHIRMNGDDFHIKTLIELLGKKLSLIILREWMKKNVLVAMKLKEVVDNLENE